MGYDIRTGRYARQRPPEPLVGELLALGGPPLEPVPPLPAPEMPGTVIERHEMAWRDFGAFLASAHTSAWRIVEEIQDEQDAAGEPMMPAEDIAARIVAAYRESTA